MGNPNRKLKKILFILGIAGAVYIGFLYLLPLVVPFLCAYGVALWLRPSVRFVERKLNLWLELWRIRNVLWKGVRWTRNSGKSARRVSFERKQRRNWAAWIGALELTGIFTVLAGLLYFGGSRLFAQLQRFTASIPQWISWLDVKLTGFCRWLEQVLGLKNDYLVAVVRDMIRELGSTMRQGSMPAIMNNSMTILAWLTGGIVFLAIFIIATLMFLQEMEEIRERKSRSMFHREFALIGRRLVTAGSAWLKTEVVILSVTSGLCMLGLFLIGNDYALLLGIGIGLLDALPFLGAGVVLIPWGILLLSQGQWFAGGVLLALYLVCYLLRQVLEAKIMGNRMGLSPIETLVSMYVGLQLFGLAGFLLGPIGLLLIEDLVDFYWNEEDVRGQAKKWEEKRGHDFR